MRADKAVASPLDILHQLYPSARVTSTRRDPNSPLGRANPRSYHNIGQAFDVAPIPGVRFGDYVNSLKSNGVNVVEALDEATHPLPHTTGPNWHIAFGGASVAPQKKPRTLGQIVMKPDMGPMSVDMGAQAPAQAPMTLANLALPQGQIPQKKPSLFGKGGLGWKILGVLGDSYLEANGKQGAYIPTLLHNRQMEAEQQQRQEEFAQRLELERQKALEPPQFIQNAQAWAGLSPEQKRMVLQQQDAVNPINVATPMGTQNVPRTSIKTINGKTYYSIGGEWYEESQ